MFFNLLAESQLLQSRCTTRFDTDRTKQSEESRNSEPAAQEGKGKEHPIAFLGGFIRIPGSDITRVPGD